MSNYKYKLGDLVQHKRGCVLFYRGQSELGIHVKDLDGRTIAWPASKCSPYRDPSAVIEAARKVVEDAVNSYSNATALHVKLLGSASKGSAWSLNGALAAYDGGEEEKEGEPDSPWITDRRPTKEDGFEVEDDCFCVYIYDDGDIILQFIDDVEDGQPWQPVPECLRVPPKEEEQVEEHCEECAHHCEGVDLYPLVKESVNCCVKTKSINPWPGMPRCEFKRREE